MQAVLWPSLTCSLRFCGHVPEPCPPWQQRDGQCEDQLCGRVTSGHFWSCLAPRSCCCPSSTGPLQAEPLEPAQGGNHLPLEGYSSGGISACNEVSGMKSLSQDKLASQISAWHRGPVLRNSQTAHIPSHTDPRLSPDHSRGPPSLWH